MREVATQDGRFEPLHDAHAIEQMALNLSFEGTVGEAQMRALLAASGQFKEDLPGVSDLQTVSFAIANHPAGFFPGPRPMVGRSFKRSRPDGTIETEVRIEANALTYQTTAYTRWATVWEHAWGAFKLLLPMYLSDCRLAALNLNYVDKFRWVGSFDNYSPKALLRSGSPYICPHVFDLDDMWHSHTGAFIRASQRTKRLLNLNLDCLDQQDAAGVPARTVQITTVLTDMLNQPGYTPSNDISAESVPDFAKNVFDDLHRFSKQVVAQVLNDDMCKRIALNDVE